MPCRARPIIYKTVIKPIHWQISCSIQCFHSVKGILKHWIKGFNYQETKN